MKLDEDDTNKIAIIAVLIISGKTEKELKELQQELAKKQRRGDFLLDLRQVLKQRVVSDCKLDQYCNEILRRVDNSLTLKLAARSGNL